LIFRLLTGSVLGSLVAAVYLTAMGATTYECWECERPALVVVFAAVLGTLVALKTRPK
jgi:hypothetical protein